MDIRKTYMVIDGERFVNETVLIENMVKACIELTDVDDIEVMDDERDLVSAYQYLLKMFSVGDMLRKFKTLYVNERFIKRTLGV